jgi:hypothetical protein
MKTNSSDISVNHHHRPHINPSSTLPQACDWAYENYSFTISVAQTFMEIYRVTNRFFFCQLTIKSSKNSRWKSLIIQTPYSCVRLCWFFWVFPLLLLFLCFIRTYACKTRWCMSIFISHHELAGDGNLLVSGSKQKVNLFC